MSHVLDLEEEFLRLYEACKAETMTSLERMYALCQATCYVLDRDIPGDLAECGVWRGGSVMLMALTLLSRGRTDRTIWLYDTFDGMTPPGGVLIVDDYGYWRGARKATDEFFQTLGARPLLHRVDYTGRICVKP